MLVPVYIGKRFRAAAAGSTTKTVRCEQCAGEFSYEIRRTGQAEAESAYFLDNEGARERAQQRADEALNEKLLDAIEPTPCPHCRWMQREMVRELRRRSHPILFWLWGITVPFLMGILLFFVIFLGTNFFDMPIPAHLKLPAWLLFVGTVVSALVGLGWRYCLVCRIEPNKDWAPNQACATNQTIDAAKGSGSLAYAPSLTANAPRRRNRLIPPLVLLFSGFGCWIVAVMCIIWERELSDVGHTVMGGGVAVGFILVMTGAFMLKRLGY